LQISIFSFSQNNQILVEYEAIKGNIINKEALIATKEKAFYLTDSLLIENENNANITEIDEYNNEITISQKRIKLDATKYFIKRNDNIIYFTQIFRDKPSLVKDSLPNFDWDLKSSETKIIGNFLCKKATTDFRGSQIVAWYSEELNIPFGPWKFKDLPGLILELYNVNDTSIHHWIAKKIIYPYKIETQFTSDNKFPTVEFATVVEDMEDQIKEQMKRMQSRVPQGVTVTETKLNRTGIEKKYEWEK
jgi:GLPGLI family protein